MAKIKLTKTAVESAQPQAKDVELRDTVVPGFLCKITPTGRRVFMLQYRTNAGQPRKPSLGLYGELTVEQARVMAQDWLAEVRRGGDPGGAKAEARKAPTMAELCKKFMEDYSKKRNKPSTQDGYQGVIDRCIIPLLGRKKVQDVKRPDIAGLMEKLAYKPTEANKTFGVLRKMFNLAEVWGYRPDGTNPCRHVPMYPPGKETRLIVDEEMALIFRQLEKLEAEGLENYVIPLAIRLQFEFAARRSEICPLEWSWLDFENRRVVWPDSKTGGISKPMSEEAYRLLSTAPRREAALRPAVAQRPGQAPDLWRALWRLVPGAQGRRRAARRHARHPPSLDDRHCQFGRADQGGHEADGPQDRGDVHALRPHRGQAGARCGRAGGQPAPGHHGRAAACGGGGMNSAGIRSIVRSAFGAAGRHSGTDRGGAQARRLGGE
jgi:integrase